MAVQFQGSSGIIAEVDGGTFKAIRTVSKPIDYGSLGHYGVSTTVPLLASQAANGTLFSFRWADATRLCVPNYIRLQVLQSAAAAAVIAPAFQVFLARGWTTSDSGGLAHVLAGNAFKKRTNMGTTLVADMRKSSTTAGLTAGARTLDSEPMLDLLALQTPTNPNTTIYSKEIDLTNSGDHPFVFAANEGFIVRGPTVAFGLTGTANLVIDIAWAEVTAY